LCVPLQVETSAVSDEPNNSSGLGQLYVSHLANWWFSLAFMEAMWEQLSLKSDHSPPGGSKKTTSTVFQGTGRVLGGYNDAEETEEYTKCDTSLSELLLSEAVYMWPHIVPGLLTYMNPSPAVSDLQVRVNSSSLFKNGREKLDQADKKSAKAAPVGDGVLEHLAEIYAIRQVPEIFANEDAVSLLQAAVERAIGYFQDERDSVEHIVGQQHEGYTHFSYTYLQNSASLQKYRFANEDDFKDRFPHLPEDANPIEPQLLDPILFENEQIQRQRQHLHREGIDLSQLLGIDVEAAEDGKTAAFTKRFQRAVRARGGDSDSLLQALAGLDFSLLMEENTALWNVDATEGRDGDSEGDFVDKLVRYLLPTGRPGVGAAGPDGPTTAMGAAVGAPAHSDEDFVSRGHILDAVRPEEGYILDMNAPLMQLFLQSIMPWFRWNH
jgi:hypothetical protein